jgi:hypothetical protein
MQMSDAYLRSSRRRYAQGLLSAEAFLAILRRGGARPIWDWMAGNTGFYDLPLREQVTIFEERWPVGVGDISGWALAERLDSALEGTAKFNNRVVWLGAHPDAPDVAEILAETLGDFAFHYGSGISPDPWSTLEDYTAMQVMECHHFIRLLRHYRCL